MRFKRCNEPNDPELYQISKVVPDRWLDERWPQNRWETVGRRRKLSTSQSVSICCRWSKRLIRSIGRVVSSATTWTFGDSAGCEGAIPPPLLACCPLSETGLVSKDGDICMCVRFAPLLESMSRRYGEWFWWMLPICPLPSGEAVKKGRSHFGGTTATNGGRQRNALEEKWTIHVLRGLQKAHPLWFAPDWRRMASHSFVLVRSTSQRIRAKGHRALASLRPSMHAMAVRFSGHRPRICQRSAGTLSPPAVARGPHRSPQKQHEPASRNRSRWVPSLPFGRATGLDRIRPSERTVDLSRRSQELPDVSIEGYLPPTV